MACWHGVCKCLRRAWLDDGGDGEATSVREVGGPARKDKQYLIIDAELPLLQRSPSGDSPTFIAEDRPLGGFGAGACAGGSPSSGSDIALPDGRRRERSSSSTASGLAGSVSEASHPLTMDHKDYGVGDAPPPPQEHIRRRDSDEQLVLSNTGSIADYYSIAAEVIGRGGFGQVRIATQNATGEKFAVKLIRQDVILCVRHFQKEVDITMSLNHPHIVKTFECFEDFHYVYFVMAWCRGGELFDRVLQSPGGKFSEPEAALILQQICSAVAYMHDHGIVHRDLKPENCLFESKDPIMSTPLRLIDFGLARRFEPGEVMTSAVGTPSYVAPEVLRGSHTSACDLWSIGVLLYICLCGCVPFDADTPKEILKRVKKGAYSLDHGRWAGVSGDAKRVVRGLLDKHPTTRLTAAQVLGNVWLPVQMPSFPESGAKEG